MNYMKSQNIVIVMMILGFILSMYFLSIDSEFQSKLIEINKINSINLNVNGAYNERGIYILNDKYFVNSATYVLGDDYSLSQDDAIWRPKDKKFKPSISDISAPFEIHKNKNSDTLKLIKGGKTMILLLKN